MVTRKLAEYFTLTTVLKQLLTETSKENPVFPEKDIYREPSKLTIL